MKDGKTVPYCDHDKKTAKKEKKKKKSKAGGILALLFCVAIGVCSEYSTEIEQFCMKIYKEYLTKLMVIQVVANLDKQVDKLLLF